MKALSKTTAKPRGVTRSAAHTTKEILLVGLLLFASLLTVHRATLFSSFAITQGGGDSLLYNFILEHEWRWAVGHSTDRSLWSPPIFFPQRNTAAYTDLFLGALPPYAIWRIFRADPQTAFQLWILTVSALNFIAAYSLLRLLLGSGVAASAAGAVLFAFGSPRLMQMGHPQLWLGFYTLCSFAGLYLLFSHTRTTEHGGRISGPSKDAAASCAPFSHTRTTERGGRVSGPSKDAAASCALFSQRSGSLSRRRVYAGLLLFLGGAVAQFYTAFYYAWFMAFCASVALASALCINSCRTPLVDFLRRWWRAAGISILGACLLLGPANAVYYNVMEQVGSRQYKEVAHFLPVARAWLAQGPDHWIYGALNRWAGIDQNFGFQEMFNGIGLLTTFLVLAAFIRFRHRRVVMLWGIVVAAVCFATLLWPNEYSLWHAVFLHFPGAQAIRAVSRFGVFLLLPAAIALTLSIDWLMTSVSPVIAILCIAAVFAEQAGALSRVPAYNKLQMSTTAETLAHRIGPGCKAFLVSFPEGQASVSFMHIFGMWAELYSGIPTLNGYSGQFPPDWPLGNVAIGNRVDRLRLYEALKSWMEEHPSQIDNVCWIEPDAPAPILLGRADLRGDEWFRRIAYLDLLGRSRPGPELSSPKPGIDRAAFVKRIMETPEFRERESFVLTAYRKLFGTDPPYPVWLANVAHLEAGHMSPAQLLDAWKRSDECRVQSCRATVPDPVLTEPERDPSEQNHDSLVLLYFCLLQRAPTASELAEYSAPPPASPIQRVLQSPEFQRQIQ